LAYANKLVETAMVLSGGHTIKSQDIVDAARLVDKKRVVTDFVQKKSRGEEQSNKKVKIDDSPIQLAE
jgi:hypothetical protein